jgi:hypothetical protein
MVAVERHQRRFGRHARSLRRLARTSRRSSKEFYKTGFEVHKVDIEVKEFLSWATDEKIEITGFARSSFANLKLGKQESQSP